MTSPGAHGEGEAVNLWRNDWKHSPMPWVGVKWETCDRPAGSTEYRALPVDAYNALLARANTAKVAADLMRARAERAEALLWECRALFLNGPAFADLRSRVDSVLGAGA